MNIRRILSTILLLLFLFTAMFSCSLPNSGEGTGGDNDGVIDPGYTFDELPTYQGAPYVAINNNSPFFSEDEIKISGKEDYAPLDALGRCGVAYACIGKESMPTDKREEIGSVTPSGWTYNKVSNNKKYDFVSGGYVYNRCHLIGFQLAGENDNDRNLITGTRYLNISSMLVFEDMVADYVKATGNHVLYRVTPIFEGENLVCSGVLLEGISIEDGGEDLKFCVYGFNVQPGVTIDYFTGRNVSNGEELPPIEDTDIPDSYSYIINIKSKTIHLASCKSAASILEANRAYFEGDTEVLLEEYPGYKGCGSCLPDLVIPDSGSTPDTEEPPTTGENDDTRVVTYIVNIKTNKYHLPTCKSAPTSSATRVEFYGNLDQLLLKYPGCLPCGSCNP